MLKSRGVKWGVALIVLGVLLVLMLVPQYIDQKRNKIEERGYAPLSEQAMELHSKLFIGDWHSDSLMWSRDITQDNEYGHMDFPRLLKGNVSLQMFTTVTKSPSGLNYDSNHADAPDNITKLALVSRWPVSTWNSLTARAVYQAQRLHDAVARYPEQVFFINSKQALAEFLLKRAHNPHVTAALLGTEGSHALDGNLDNIQRLYDHGFRMMSLHHFFDNKLGGSLHGKSGAGLSQFGQQALEKMESLNIIVDVSHSSEQVVKDVLAISTQPIVVSHTGFYGHCPSARNISDELMQQIAKKGGLIAVGYWDGALCNASVVEIAKAIKYGIELVGAKHVALGSDFDGATTVPFDTANLVYLTQALINEGVSEHDIRLVMGENMLRFLASELPGASQ